jgi:hypothetical protein
LTSIGLATRIEPDNNTNDRDSITLPTPQRLGDEFIRLAEEDADSGIYYPDLRLSPGGQFDGSSFIDAFADLDEDGFGKYPIAVDELGYYGHDLAAEHLVALMARGSGRPLMQAISRFAAVVKGSEELDLPNGGFEGKVFTLSGGKKDDRAAVIIDNLTTQFNSVVYDTDHPDTHSKAYEGRSINGLVKTLRGAGQLNDLEVVQFMLKTGVVESVVQIT